MRVLKASEIARAKHPNLPEHILASEEKSGLWVSRQDIKVAEAQAKLTDEDWIKWLDTHAKPIADIEKIALGVKNLYKAKPCGFRVLSEQDLQVRLKEVG